jgi:hypothetical protein
MRLFDRHGIGFTGSVFTRVKHSAEPRVSTSGTQCQHAAIFARR